MKKQFLFVLALILGLTGLAMAEEKAVEKVANKICPISGEAVVKGQEATVEYNGKVYNLCCAMCKKDFLKDPEKAIQKLKDAGETK